MNDLISIIVPVYNVEKFLQRCIDSILDQSYKYFELILVNDGSTDNSLSICCQYELKDSRIKVINKKNGGLSDARNIGIDIANGKYICFIDSDDYVHNSYLEHMYKTMIEQDVDMVVCGYEPVSISEQKNINEIFDCHIKILNQIQSVDRIYSNIPYESLVIIVAWNKLYKKSIFDNLKYPYGKTSEDNFIVIDVIKKCNKIAICEAKLYYYCLSENSITRSAYSKKNFDLLDALENRISKLDQYGNQILKKHCTYYLSQIFNDYFRTNDKSLKKTLKNRFRRSFMKIFIKNNLLYNSSIIKLFVFFISPILAKNYINLAIKIRERFN